MRIDQSKMSHARIQARMCAHMCAQMSNGVRAGSLRSLLGTMVLGAGCVSLGFFVDHACASAWVLPVQDGMSYMVVDRDDTALRCGDQDVFYAIARLKKGTVLRTGSTSGAYTRVVMPVQIGAMVPATEVQPSSDGQRVTLRVASKLRAPSQLMGLSGSWKQLYATALPEGTTLEVIERLTNDAGAVVGYRVKTPKSSSGELPIAYIPTDALRPALRSEIEGNASDPSPTNDPAKATSRPLPETDEGAAPTAISQSQPSEGVAEVDTSLLEEQVSSQPVEITNSTPVEPKPQRDHVRHAEEGKIPASQLEDLESTFTRARSLQRAELDDALDELLAEFARTRALADGDESLALALDQRIEWIKIRMQTRDQRNRIAQALADYDSGADQTTRAIEAWQQGRAYQLVGRMVTSSVYTGENLPLLYRVQGTDAITGQPRTIGYIAPRQDQDLRHMLGRVVGVLGVKREDASLGLRVVEPDRVDLMPE